MVYLKLLFVGILFSSSSCSLIPTDGVYLLPEGFRGGVVILFDQPYGIRTETEGGRYVYLIPDDGVLRATNSPPTGIIGRDYYFVAAGGQRMKIDYLRITGDRSVQGFPQNKFGNITQHQHDNKIYIMNAGGIGSFNTPNGTVQFTSFIVSTPKDSAQAYREMENRISEIQRDMSER